MTVFHIFVEVVPIVVIGGIVTGVELVESVEEESIGIELG